MTHSFDDSFAKERAAHLDIEYWQKIYKIVFSKAVALSDPTEEQDRSGIDRIVTSGGKEWKVQEKIRFADYDDILIEGWSNKEKRIKGWVTTLKNSDFLVVSFPSRAFVFKSSKVLAATVSHGRYWWTTLPHILAKNESYTTESVAVPINRFTGLMGTFWEIRHSRKIRDLATGGTKCL